jgi:hypothetical protein
MDAETGRPTAAPRRAELDALRALLVLGLVFLCDPSLNTRLDVVR